MNTEAMNNVRISTLRPGLLVALSTRVVGNIRYTKREIEPDHVTEDGGRRYKREIERVILDAAEHEQAEKIRSKASNMVRAVCVKSDHGLLAPESQEATLRAAVAEARTLAREFNATAFLTSVVINVYIGRVSPDDVEAIRSINQEVRDLLAVMEQGIQKLDVKTVREAAAKAKELGAMLSGDAQERIKLAVNIARESAKRIVKAGETASLELDQFALDTLREARTAFLDMDTADAVIAIPEAVGRALEFEIQPIAEEGEDYQDAPQIDDIEPQGPIEAPAPQQVVMDI